MQNVPFSGLLIVTVVAFLLFLAGLEVELERLRGRLLLFVGSSFLMALGLALLVGYVLYLAGQVVSLLLVAIILVVIGLGIIVPVLKNAGRSSSGFGQLIIASAMCAEFGSIILLSLSVLIFPLIALTLLRGSKPSPAQAFGDNACHPERSEGSGSPGAEILPPLTCPRHIGRGRYAALRVRYAQGFGSLAQHDRQGYRDRLYCM